MDILQQLQDTMTVLAGIQERQARVQKLQAEELDAVRERIMLLERELEIDRATHAQRMAEWDARIEKFVSGFGADIGQWDSLQKRVEALERRVQ